MSKEIIAKEITFLTEVIREQQEMVVAHQHTIPQIELDILLSNVRKLYERLLELNKINQAPSKAAVTQAVHHTTSPTDELIAQINTTERMIAGLPFVVDEQINSEKSEALSIEEKEAEPVIEATLLHQEEQEIQSQETADTIIPEKVEENPPVSITAHQQPESLLNEIETPIKAPQKEITEEAVMPQAALAKERTKEFSKPASKVNSMASLFDDAPTIATTFQGTTSVHDKITSGKSEISVAGKMQNHPVSDLKKSIGINEKFAFINELFDGDLNSYNAAIDLLNGSNGHAHAIQILETELSSKYNWNGAGDSYLRLKNLIDRRFEA